jgi:Cu+-exporting ATPase
MGAQDALVGVIEGAGFEARAAGSGAAADCDSAVLRISGMACSSCSSAVEAALAAHKGVRVRAFPAWSAPCC